MKPKYFSLFSTFKAISEGLSRADNFFLALKNILKNKIFYRTIYNKYINKCMHLFNILFFHVFYRRNSGFFFIRFINIFSYFVF